MSRSNSLRAAYYAVLAQMTVTATGLIASGIAEPQTAVFVACGLGVAAGEVGLRLFGPTTPTGPPEPPR